MHTAGDDLVAGRGSLVVIPKGAQHTFSNAGTAMVRVVGTFAPAHFERYFHELAAEIEKHAGARPDPAVIGALYATYDSVLVN